jgi:hypothetical protein
MPPGNFRNYRARDQRLFNNPGFEILRELPPPASSRNYFEPAYLNRFRLKRMVKRRHKLIPDSEAITIADLQSHKKVGSPQRLR